MGNEILARNNYWKALLLFFGKSSGISGRVTTIWPNTIRAIIEHPVFGNGTLTTLKRITINGGFAGATHAHNQVLEFLFVGGVVMLIMFVLYNIKISHVLTDNSILWTSTAISVFLFALYLMATVEVFTTINGAAIWLIIGLALYSSELDVQFKRKVKRNIVQ